MAQDATGTPTTNYAIPKFNTAADAPTGKGVNAMMDSIDQVLKNSFVGAPGGVVSGEALVWNGTSWARSSATRLTTVRPQDLGQDGAASGQSLVWNGSIWAPAAGGVQVLDRVFTDVTFASTTAENTFYSFSVPGNTLGTNKLIHLRVMGVWSTFAGGGANTKIVKAKYGTLVVTSDTLSDGSASASSCAWIMDIYLQADGDSQHQTMYSDGRYHLSNAVGRAWSDMYGNSSGACVTGTIDSTASQNLVVTITEGQNNASNSSTLRSAVTVLI